MNNVPRQRWIYEAECAYEESSFAACCWTGDHGQLTLREAYRNIFELEFMILRSRADGLGINSSISLIARTSRRVVLIGRFVLAVCFRVLLRFLWNLVPFEVSVLDGEIIVFFGCVGCARFLDGRYLIVDFVLPEVGLDTL
jgi:hypothetical protein